VIKFEKIKKGVSMSHICETIHRHFAKLPRHTFPFKESDIPSNGIYILYEKGEKAHGTDRIVRVGTHTGDNQLRSRLKQHFVSENKDRSIFRKNIGRAILAKRNDPFLEQWEWDLTTKANKEKYLPLLDREKQAAVEKEVSLYIREAFSFVAFEVAEKAERLDQESKIISTVSLCDECGPSDHWLGLYSPKAKIRESGLWLVNELYKVPLDEIWLEKLEIKA
jgi:hypothetical protein